MSDADVTGPVQVNDYLCPVLVGMLVTHQLSPRHVGKVGDEPMFEQVCVWCLRSETQLREDIATAGGALLPPLDFAGSVVSTRRGRHRA